MTWLVISVIAAVALLIALVRSGTRRPLRTRPGPKEALAGDMKKRRYANDLR
jgi:hypothetical protein